MTCLKRDLRVDSVFPLKRDMLAYRLAVVAGKRQHQHRWQPHPTRPRQQIQRVERIGAPLGRCQVPLNGVRGAGV